LAALWLWQKPGMADRDKSRAHVGRKRILFGPHSRRLNFIEHRPELLREKGHRLALSYSTCIVLGVSLSDYQ
jgi:hypothetical protein